MKEMLSGRKEKARIIYAYVFRETLAPSLPPLFSISNSRKTVKQHFYTFKNFCAGI